MICEIVIRLVFEIHKCHMVVTFGHIWSHLVTFSNTLGIKSEITYQIENRIVVGDNNKQPEDQSDNI